MIWFLLTLPFRLLGLGFKMGRGSVKVTHRSVRALGYRRLLVFGLGVGVGVLVAPGPGAELRERIRQAVSGAPPGPPEGDLVTRVRDELSSSPRTWHLPQPTVTAAGNGTVTLTGAVPDETAAADLARTANGVQGVLAVDNRLTVVPA